MAAVGDAAGDLLFAEAPTSFRCGRGFGFGLAAATRGLALDLTVAEMTSGLGGGAGSLLTFNSTGISWLIFSSF